MSVLQSLPVRFDSIQVRYLVGKNLVWWRALVEEVSSTVSGENARASGVLFFEAKMGYDRERVSCDFLEGSMLREHRRNGANEDPQPTTWRADDQEGVHPEEDEDYGPEPNVMAYRRSARVQSRNRRVQFRTVRSSRTRVNNRHHTGRNRQMRQGSLETSLESVQAELRSTHEHLELLHRKFTAHESHFMSQDNIASRTVVEEEISVTKMYLRKAILSEFQRPPRKPTTRGETEFSSVLRVGTVQCSVPCDLRSFKRLTEDILKTSTNNSDNTKFLPSLTSIMHGPHGMPLAKIVFEGDTPLLQWLGLLDPRDRETIRYRTACTQTYQAIRLVAGCRWNDVNLDSPMLIFPGKSSHPGIGMDGDSTSGEDMCLHRDSALWDEANEMF